MAKKKFFEVKRRYIYSVSLLVEAETAEEALVAAADMSDTGREISMEEPMPKSSWTAEPTNEDDWI